MTANLPKLTAVYCPIHRRYVGSIEPDSGAVYLCPKCKRANIAARLREGRLEIILTQEIVTKKEEVLTTP